jgi:hypothetical protein
MPEARRAVMGNLQVFTSFADAEEADARYYASLTPQQRLDLQQEIIARYGEALGQTDKRLERVYRVVKVAWD